MSITIQKVSNYLRNHIYLLTTLFLGALYFSILIYIHEIATGDYNDFIKIPIDLTWGIHRWFEWSSRFFIEYAVVIFSKNLLIWKVFTVIFGSLLFWSLGRLMRNSKVWQSVLLFCLFLMTNVYLLASAGIFATTINYMWPMTCFTLAIALTIYPLKNSRANLFSKILIIPIFIYAICSEQLAFIGVMLGIFYIVYKKFNNERVSKLTWTLIALSLLGIVNVLISPGNQVRVGKEVLSWWPGYYDLTIFDKVITGIVATGSRLLLAPELISLLLILFIVVLALRNRNTRALYTILPIAVITILFFFPQVSSGEKTFIALPNYWTELRTLAINFSSNKPLDNHVISILITYFAGFFISVIASLFALYGKTKKTLIMTAVFVSGLGSALLVSFSPTIFASSTRTLYPAVVAFIFLNSMMIKDLAIGRNNISNKNPLINPEYTES